MGVAPKIFEPYISTCILAGVMKLLIQALQQYIILSKKLVKFQLALKTHHKTIFQSFESFTRSFQGAIFNA